MFSMWYVPNGIKLLFKKNGWYNLLTWHGLQNTNWMYICVKMLIVDLEAGLQYADL